VVSDRLRFFTWLSLFILSTLIMVVEPIAVVGHVAIDRIITCGGERLQLGGPPTYVSLITHLLGVSLAAATKVGGDFPEAYASELASRGLDIHGFIVPTAKTTRFVLDYTKTERRLGFDSLCDPIDPRDVVGLPEAVILAPIVHEVPKETLTALDSPVLALDPQGFVRRLEQGGSISLHPWLDLDLLHRVSVFKASERELRLVAGVGGWEGIERLAKLGIEVVIETRGRDGACIQHGDRRIIVPAHLGDTVDMTGAGDAFITGFFTYYALGEDIEWCGAVGSASASAVVETVGPSIKVGRSELFERAEKVRSGIRLLT
jgi:sugar/nucleoside kinase (ribokinase family)